MSSSISKPIMNMTTQDGVKKIITATNVAESLSKSSKQIVKQGYKEVERQGIQTDADTSKVISTTKTAVSPFALQAMAISIAAAYNGVEKDIAKRAEKIDISRVEREAVKQGIDLTTYEKVGKLGSDKTRDKKYDTRAEMLKFGQTIRGSSKSSLRTTIVNPEMMHFDLKVEKPFQQTIEKARERNDIKAIEEAVKKVHSQRSNTSNYISEIREIKENNVNKYLDSLNKKLHEELQSNDSHIAEKAFAYLNSEKFENIVMTKLHVEASDVFKYKKNLISSGSISIDIKEKAIDEVRSAIVENRRADLNKVFGETKLVAKNLNSDPRAAVDFYKAFVASIKVKGGKINDPILKQQIKDSFLAEGLASSYKRLKSPKKFLRAGFRLATKPLQQSETMKGLSVARSGASGALMVGKVVHNPAFNIAYNTSMFLRKKLRVHSVAKYYNISNKAATKMIKTNHGFYQKYLNKTGKKMLRDYVKLSEFHKNVIINELKGALRRYYAQKLSTKGGELIANSNAVTGKFVGELMKNQSHLLSGAFDKGVYKMAQRAAFKSFGKYAGRKAGTLAAKAGSKVAATKVGSAVVQTATKAGAKVAATKTFGAAVKAAKGTAKAVGTASKGVKAVTSTFKAVFGAVKEALEFIAGKIAQFFAFIFKWLMAAVAIFLAFFLILQVAIVVENSWYYAMEYVDRFQSFFTTAVFDTNEETFVKMLRECHEERLDELRAIQKSYEVGDIQYPSGENENYKELYCAMAVQCQYNFNLLTKKEMKDIAKDLYDQTHRTSWEPYEFKTDDGVTHTAVHVYLDILRGEGVAIEAIAGNWLQGAGEIGAWVDNGSPRASATGVVVNDWMNVVENVKRVIASTGCEYSQQHYVTVSVNDQVKSIRQDCSGYVSACLQVYGSLGGTWSSYDFTNASSLPGFTRLSFNGWDSLNPGDIISYNNGGKGHVEIFAYNTGGYHYVYSNGSTTSVRSPVPTTDNRNYTTVWRPEDPGTTMDISEEETTEEGIGEYDPTAFFCIETQPSYSNTANIEFDQFTENEEGYEDTLIADINAEIAKGVNESPFTGQLSYEVPVYKPHSLTKNTSKASAWDFVRYIYAKHGVNVAMDVSDMNVKEGSTVIDDRLNVGDVIVYAPHIQRLDLIQNELESLGYSISFSNSRFRSVYANENYVDGMDTSTLEPESIEKLMYANCIPLIYIGDGKAVAYSRDVLDSVYSDPQVAYGINNNTSSITYASSQAAIRTYNVASLDPTRVYRVQKYRQFTVAPVYGATTYFEGWTDWNIACFEELLADDCWETLKKDFTLDDYDHTNSEGEVVTELDFSWYKEDLFSGNDFYHESSHADQFKTEFSPIIVAYYDGNGILPSTAFTTAAALSDYRSTEESLKYYDIYELLEEHNPDIAGESDKYSYSAKGDATVTTKDYKRFNSYMEAYEYWVRYVVLKNGISKTIMDDNPDYVRQMQIMRAYGVFSDEVLSFANDIYTSGKDPNGSMNHIYMNTQLKELDALAIHRKEAMDRMFEISKELHDTNFAPERTGSTAIGEGNESIDKQKAKHLYELLKEYKDLNEEVIKINTENNLPDTPTYLTLRNTYDIDWPSYIGKLDHLIQTRDEHADNYVQYYTCKGHTNIVKRPVFDHIIQDIVDADVEETSYDNDGHPMLTACSNCDKTYESWDDVKSLRSKL